MRWRRSPSEEGQNIVFESQRAEGKYERLPSLATKLVRLNVDVLVNNGTPGARAATQATTSIPRVIAPEGHRSPTSHRGPLPPR